VNEVFVAGRGLVSALGADLTQALRALRAGGVAPVEVDIAPGHAAHAVHVGPYANMHRTYAVLHAWCSQRALALTGQSWEVYGDPTEDPSKLATGLFLRVDEA